MFAYQEFCSTAQGQHPEVKKTGRPSGCQVLSGVQAAYEVEGIGEGRMTPGPQLYPTSQQPEKDWEDMHRG